MGDPALEALLHGTFKSTVVQEKTESSSRYDKEVRRLLSEAVDAIIAEQNKTQCSLLSPQAQRKKIEEELHSAIQYSELSQQLQAAFNVIAKGKKYLGSTPYAMMIGEFAKTTVNLDSVPLNSILEQSLQEMLKISDTTMESLLTIAIAKYEEGLFPESFSIYTLLSTLSPENPEYWLRVGITAHKCDKFELALKAYAVTCFLNPLLIEARIFATECYLKLGEFGEAKVEYDEAKKFYDSLPEEERRKKDLELFGNLEILFKGHSAA